MERAITLELREMARMECMAMTRESVDPNITNEIKCAECKEIKGAVIKQKLDMFALHEAAYKAARGENAYNNKVAGLLDEMLGCDHNGDDNNDDVEASS